MRKLRAQQTGKLLALTASLWLTACALEPSAPERKADVDFMGDWTLAAVDEQALGPDNPIRLTVREQVIRWEPGCAQRMFLYTIEGSSFRADPIRYDNRGAFDPVTDRPPPCAIGLLPDQENALEAMTAGRRIERLPDGDIRISGLGRSVVLTGG